MVRARNLWKALFSFILMRNIVREAGVIVLAGIYSFSDTFDYIEIFVHTLNLCRYSLIVIF